MKFDKNLYEGLVWRPLMMVKKSDKNSRALALNEEVGENYSLTSRIFVPQRRNVMDLFFFIINCPEEQMLCGTNICSHKL